MEGTMTETKTVQTMQFIVDKKKKSSIGNKTRFVSLTAFLHDLSHQQNYITANATG